MQEIDTAIQVAQAGPAPETWIGFAKYALDKVWPLIVLLAYAGGLATKRPQVLRRKGSQE